jgi:hypothetical protein
VRDFSDSKGDKMTIQTTVERLKREKLEIERKSSESREEQALLRAKMKQAGRDTFDKDLDNISYETLDALVHRSDSATISAASMPRKDIKETDLDRLRSALGKQLSSVPENVSKVDFVEGYIERAKERWESELKDALQG